MTKWVYTFGDGAADGHAAMKNLLGGKGANLAEMAGLGLPVPPGLTITTEVCTHYYANDRAYPSGLEEQVAAGIAHMERLTGARFGDALNPLLVSVRSGARVSMPGMMDTVLNLGLNSETVEGLAKASRNPRFAYDSYRRFIHMYADVVLGMDHYLFEDLIETARMEKGITLDTGLDADDLKRLAEQYLEVVENERGEPFPQDPREQLWGAIGAVFGSWRVERAKTYRRLHGIPEDWGTAVTVQAMVFGNMGDDSATGVAFTRNPSTGERAIFGEYLVNAQGEDVVAGIRTPQNLTARARQEAGDDKPSMEEAMPEVFSRLCGVFDILEKHYRDMQDIEFTVQRGKLWMLQTRGGKRTARAALKIAVDMVSEGLISTDEAILRVDPLSLNQMLHPALDPAAKKDVLARGLPASPGAATGAVVFDAGKAEEAAKAGEAVILVRIETSPEDIHGMHAARGILTARGGMTSHAAVVARGMGKPCVSGAGALQIDLAAARMTILGREFREGDIITIDGASGEVMAGSVPMVQPDLSDDFSALMIWADTARTLRVRANADTPADARTAREYGCEGIGLCRTEHMFFDATRIAAMREMIVAMDETGRRAALDKLLPMQRSDFEALFAIMRGLPVTIRLLDPPLHEFLPHEEKDLADIAAATGAGISALKSRVSDLRECNPMLGHRGCRLAITYPEIYEMQVRAIFEAMVRVEAETGDAVVPEIMIPLILGREELAIIRSIVDAVAEDVFAENRGRYAYHVGTMIELPRAALRAGDIAHAADFFSFGTNDLTQTTLGLSRDDAGRFLPVYVERGIFANDPFVSLDVEGVGELIRIARDRGRKAAAGLKLGICGEHGGDPASVAFCHEEGLDYVSCSPYRVPIARLAAAQAALRARMA